MSNLPPELDELIDALQAQAQGVHTVEAAVDLLVGHREWLRRRDFRDELVDGPRDGYAFIDWPAVPAFLEHAGCSGGEGRILRIAAELVGVDTGHGLDELLTGLDEINGRLVLDAVAHALHLPAPCGGAGEGIERLLLDVVDVFSATEAGLWCKTIRARLAEADPARYAAWSTSGLAAALHRAGVATVMLWAQDPRGAYATRRGVRRDAVLEAIARHEGGGAR
jgi:hypothetical protein